MTPKGAAIKIQQQKRKQLTYGAQTSAEFWPNITSTKSGPSLISAHAGHK